MKTFIKLQAVALAALVACAPALAIDGRLQEVLGIPGIFEHTAPVVEQVVQPSRLQNAWNAVANSRVATGASSVAAYGYTKAQNGFTYVAGTRAGVLAGKAKDGVVNFAKAGYGKAQQAAAYLGETKAAKFTAEKATQAATKVKGAANTVVDAAKKHPYYAGAIALGAVAAGTAMYLGYKAYQSKVGAKKLSTKPAVDVTKYAKTPQQHVQNFKNGVKQQGPTVIKNNLTANQLESTSRVSKHFLAHNNTRLNMALRGYDLKNGGKPFASKQEQEKAIEEASKQVLQSEEVIAKAHPTLAQKTTQQVKTLGRNCKTTACNAGNACKTGLNKATNACKNACNKVRKKVSFR